MNRHIRRLVAVILTLALLSGSYIYVDNPITPVEDIWAETAADFAKNEDYYYELCSSVGLSAQQKVVCSDFRDYVAQKQEDLEDLIADNEANIEKMKDNIASQGQKIQELNDKIDEIETDITRLDKAINKIQTNITNLEEQIAQRQQHIDELNAGIKQRMAANQTNVALNVYIRFIMGASSLVDMFRRITALNDITAYDLGQIEEVEAEKKLLQADVDELASQKTDLESDKTEAEGLKSSLTKLKKQAQQLVREYQRIEANLINEIDDAKDDVAQLEKVMDDIDKALGDFYPSDKFYHFVNHSFYVSTGCYYYTWGSLKGNFHGAVDAALGSSNSIYAVANGYVVSVGTGCSRGWLGNTCNNGKGNYVMYVCQVGDIVYGIMCQHMSSVSVKVGDLLKGGKTVLGKVGSTGSSTGNHVHFAMYYLKGYTISSAIKYYAKLTSRSYYWGLAYNINSACSYRNYKAPCILNPSDYYKIYYNKTYYW